MVKKTHPGDRPETLAQFSADVDAYYERAVGFADAVTRLAVVRATARRAEQRRKDIYEEVKKRHAQGAGFVAQRRGVSGGGYFVRTVTSRVSTKRAVPSAVIQKAHPELWEQARVRVNRLAVTPPKTIELPVRGLKLPPAGANLRLLDFAGVIESYKSPLFDVLAALKDEETRVRGELEEIGQETDWSGEELRFADGWNVALWRMEYSDAQLAKIAPKVWDGLAVEKQTGGTSRLDIMDLESAIAKGYVEEGDYDQFAD